MKKQYANPSMKIVIIDDADIITQSESMTLGEDVSNVSAGAKRRGDIWGEDE